MSVTNKLLPGQYTFDNIWLVKDGQYSICPFNPGLLRPDETGISMNKSPRLVVQNLFCNKSCPFFNAAVQKNNETQEEVTGYALTCRPTPIFIQVIEKKLK